MTYAVTVAANAPGTGTPPTSDTVTFKDGGVNIAGCVATAGLQRQRPATCTPATSSRSAGSHTITAVYGG